MSEMHPQYPATGDNRPSTPRRLVRSDDRWLGGVCGGIAEYTGTDPNLVRLVAIVAGLVSFGTAALVYVAAWLLMPEE